MKTLWNGPFLFGAAPKFQKLRGTGPSWKFQPQRMEPKNPRIPGKRVNPVGKVKNQPWRGIIPTVVNLVVQNGIPPSLKVPTG